MKAAQDALMVPLYKLLYIDDVAAFEGLDEGEVETIAETYAPSELADMAAAIRGACANPQADLTGIHLGLEHDNAAIHTYLTRVQPAFEVSVRPSPL